MNNIVVGSRSMLRGAQMNDPLGGSMHRRPNNEAVSKQATRVTAISAKLEWRIEQFEKLMKLFKNGQNLISKQFFSPQAPTVVWELHSYPNGKRDEDSSNVSFFLRQVGLQRGEDPIMVEFQIYTLDASNIRISVCRDTKDFANQQGRGKFQVQREKMMQALRADGSLLLVCEVEYLPPGSKICVEQESESAAVVDDSMKVELFVRESMREMLDAELFSDCTIQVGTKQIHAHRCILALHSEVFRSMFAQKHCIEAQNGTVTIVDSRPEPIRAMLEFIYSGSLNPAVMDAHAQGILAIADKYAIMPLKDHCERYLAASITKQNITQMVVISDTYDAQALKKACIRFISAHHKSVLKSPEWKELKSMRSALSNELLEAVLDEQSANSGDEVAEAMGGVANSSGGGGASLISHVDSFSTYSSNAEYTGGGGGGASYLLGSSGSGSGVRSSLRHSGGGGGGCGGGGYYPNNSGGGASSSSSQPIQQQGPSTSSTSTSSSSQPIRAATATASDNIQPNLIVTAPKASVDDESGTPRKRLRRITPRNA